LLVVILESLFGLQKLKRGASACTSFQHLLLKFGAMTKSKKSTAPKTEAIIDWKNSEDDWI
jgi:hypothetical protein